MLSLQNSKTFSSCKEDRKGEEDCNDYPANLNVMQGCNCACEPTPECIKQFERSGLQQWALNSYTTTGHTLPQSHLPTKQDAYITTHQCCQWQKQEHSQPLQLGSLLHTKHTSLSHQIDCYSAVQGQLEVNNNAHQTLGTEITAMSLLS